MKESAFQDSGTSASTSTFRLAWRDYNKVMSRVVRAAAILGILSTPLVAQRGMHAGGRVSMGFAPARAGFARAPQMRPQFVAPRPVIMARPRTALGPQRRGVITFGHINGGPFFTTPRFGRRFDRRFRRRTVVFAFPFYGGYWPYAGFDPSYSFGSYSYDPAANTSSYSDLNSQIGELDAEVGELRDENDSLRSALDEQHRPAAPVAPTSAAAATGPATVFVFRDGHRTEVQNYAIVGSTLWMLSPTRANKVPLSDLDLDQTVKANEERGLSFSLPKSENR